MIGLLSYNVPHRKTYDVISLLNSWGYKDVNVYAAPLHYIKHFLPLIEHRPPINMHIPSTQEICKNIGYGYFEGSIESFNIPDDELLLVCGAGIIADSFIKRHLIVNSHPGYIPECRGLDALKWAIYEGKTIGVTTHIIGEYVDAGYIIDRRIIPVKYNDTFHALALRVYENEVSMLVEAVKKIDESHEFIAPGDTIIHKRMPHELDQQILERFDMIRRNVQEIP